MGNHDRTGLPCTIVRPGIVIGPGKKAMPGFVGIDTFGFFMHMGGGSRLPLTYVDNCADAIVLAGLVPESRARSSTSSTTNCRPAGRFCELQKAGATLLVCSSAVSRRRTRLCALWERDAGDRLASFRRSSIVGAAPSHGRVTCIPTGN